MWGEDQLFNRFSLGLYEPGSIFKTYTMTMALDSEAINIKNTYNVSSPIHVSRFNITDYKPRNGWLSVPEIFKYSSNIGAAKISIDLGKRRQQYFLQNFGLLAPIAELEIPEKAAPLYPTVDNWSDLSIMTISYGHGIALTPMHLIKAGAVMVNGSYLHKITLLKRENTANTYSVKIIGDKTFEYMRKLLRLVVKQGTGRKADVIGYWVINLIWK